MSLNKLTLSAALSLGVLVSGCSLYESGTTVNSSSFGDAAFKNRILQMDRLGGGAQAEDLGDLFAQTVPDTVLFAFNGTELGPNAQSALALQAQWLEDNPQARFEIEGHTDAVGGETFNDDLGLRRANAVIEYLVGLGVERNRLFAVQSLGERALAVPTNDREALNRRVVTRVAGTRSAFSGQIFDGKRAAAIYDSYITGGNVIKGGGDLQTGQ